MICMIIVANSESANVLTLSLIVNANRVWSHIHVMLRQMPSHAMAMASPTPLCISFFGQIGSQWKTLLPGELGCHGVNQTPALTVIMVGLGLVCFDTYMYVYNIYIYITCIYNIRI